MKKTMLAITLLLPLSAMATEWTGTVVGVSDGDTLTVLNTQKRQVKVRLVEIDAPEKKQAFGEQSKQSLSEICFKKIAIIDDKGYDKYKRTLGRVHCDGVDANLEQVRRGMAWAYKQFLTDQSIAVQEQAAKSSSTGLWSEVNPTPPWDFRHGKKSAVSKNSNIAKSNNSYITGPRGGCYTHTTSGNKRYVDHSLCAH
jgi:endonuclease YncB( thermonuclease family)